MTRRTHLSQPTALRTQEPHTCDIQEQCASRNKCRGWPQAVRLGGSGGLPARTLVGRDRVRTGTLVLWTLPPSLGPGGTGSRQISMAP